MGRVRRLWFRARVWFWLGAYYPAAARLGLRPAPGLNEVLAVLRLPRVIVYLDGRHPHPTRKEAA